MSFNPYTIAKIGKITSCEIAGNELERIIKHLLLDSRRVVTADESLFFAIVGERHNGHKFIPELYKRGVRAFVVSEKIDIDQYPQATFLFCNNTIEVLQIVTAYHRQQFAYPVIGITGSNGKTIVKEWLYQLLQQEKHIVRSPKSYNSQIGVPLSVWQMSEEHELGVFEAGISLPNEMEKLEKVIKPTIGLFTNIGEAHAENFKNHTQKVEEKVKLFKNTQVLVFCKDQKEVKSCVEELGVKTFSWSQETHADLQITQIHKSTNNTKLKGLYEKIEVEITIPFTDAASVENACHCWAVLLFFGIENKTITERMERLSSVALRLNLNAGVNNCSIINDSYNSDIGSLGIALDFLNQQNQHKKKTVILSDIFQSGKNNEELYSQIAEMINKKGIQRIIGIGKNVSMHFKKFHTQEKKFYFDTQNFLEDFSNLTFQDEAVLLKGARAFAFEKIGKLLQQKAHETELEIDLSALEHNLNFFRSKISPKTKIMAMVKAFSYGSGSYEIANLLQYHHVDYLAVAYADEGVELRKAGITLPILVMNPEHQSFDLLIKYRLEPELYNLRVLKQFIAAYGTTMVVKQIPCPIHIKLDTGMHRLGFEEEQLPNLLSLLKENKELKVVSVFSHLAASDDITHDDFTKQQLKMFTSMANKIEQELDYSFLRHIANTSAVLRLPESHLDMVRIGIGLYGIGHKELQNVSTFKTNISQIKQVKAGESIGYDRKEIVENDTTIATVSIGYADGLSRQLGNRKGAMLVNGKKAEIVGNICMDMCMLDITNMLAKEGDEVIVFGKGILIADFAESINTIPYDVLTGVSRRVKRVYYQE